MQASTIVSVRRPPASTKARRDLCAISRSATGAPELRFCVGRELRRADQGHVAAVGESRISARVYSRPTVAFVPSTVTRLLIEPAQAGLIAGTVPTKGTEKRARSCGSTSVEAVCRR